MSLPLGNLSQLFPRQRWSFSLPHHDELFELFIVLHATPLAFRTRTILLFRSQHSA